MATAALPIGIQDFRKIRENGFKYIDKTMYLYGLCQSPGSYFLSRPRRFGKSVGLPNKEVRDSMLEVLIEGFVGVDAESSTTRRFGIWANRSSASE